jgi:hypothetical protein
MPQVYGIGGLISVPQGAIKGNGPPGANFRGQLGQDYFDMTDPTSPVQYTFNGNSWVLGGNAAATTSSFGIVELATLAELQGGTAPAGAYVPTANDVATVIAGVVAGAVPPANESQAGIAEIATQAETDAGTDDTRIVSPLKLANFVAAGGGNASFVDLTATGTVSFTGVTGGLTMTSTTASSLGVTGGGIDLTLDSDAGRLVLTGGEAAADAVRIQADNGAGGIDVDAGTGGITVDTTAGISLDSAAASNFTVTGATEDLTLASVGGSVLVSSTENVALAIRLHANGGTSETIQIHSDQGTGVGSINLLSDAGGITVRSTGLASNDAINLEAAAGGVDIDAALQVNIASSQNAADAIVINAAAGGIDITNTGTAGEDIDIASTGASVNISSTENAAQAVYIRTNGGTSETLRLHVDQGTGAGSLMLGSDVGGITIDSGLASADAINITASAGGGGIDVDAGTAGFIVDTTGSISLDAAAASNFTATGAFDVSIISTAGSVILNGEEAAADAIQLQSAAGGIDVNAALEINIDSSEAAVADAVRIVASAADGGIDVDAGTGGIAIDTTGALSLDSAAASNFTVTGAADLTLASTAGSINVTAGEAAADAIVLTASNAAGGIDITTGGGSIDISSAGFVSVVAATDTQASPSAASTLDVNVGAVTFTGFTTASGSTQAFTITNGIVTTSSVIQVTACNEGANDAQMTVTRVQRAAGSFVVTLTNNGAAALNGNVTISFWVLQA